MDKLSAAAFADSLMRRYPNPDDYPYRSWSYPQGFLLMGIARLYEATKDARYLDYVKSYYDGHIDEEGTLTGFTGCSMDDMMPGAALVWLYQATRDDPRYAAAAHQIRATFEDYPRTREGGFLHNRTHFPGEMWVDGVFMGEEFLGRYGVVFDRPEDLAETVHQLMQVYDYCHTHDGLLSHAYSEDSKAAWAKENGQAQAVWSEGLGWYAMVIVDVIELLPEGFAGKERVIRQTAELMAGLKWAQDAESGLWYQVVDRGDDPNNWCDTSGSAMFLYALRRAVDLGIVPAAAYEETISRGYRGVLSRIEPAEDGGYDVLTACDGLGVQLTYDDYLRFPQQPNAKEAVAAVLWALEAMDRST